MEVALRFPFLYYQGESDENNHTIYRSLLQNLVEEWRKLWKDDELAFAIVQLPVFATDEKTGCGWGAIRKAQQDVYKTIKNTSLTVITDCGMQYDIHPTDKQTVGNRLAANAIFLYHESITNPEKVRYGNRNYYRAELKDGKGYPVMPFWFE